MKEKFLLSLIILLCSVNVYSQKRSAKELKGVVLSNDKVPVSYATVVAKVKEPFNFLGTISDDNGYFKLSLNFIPDSIEINCFGFEEKKISFEELSDTIFISPKILALDEVVVKGKRPMVKLQGSAMLVNIQGTVLANESNLIDLLRKTPGLIANDGGFSTMEGYTPTFYLNGRKISSVNEVKNIDVKSIKSIEVDTSPGAKYGSSEKAVIHIRTTSSLEGFSLIGKTFARINKRFTHDHSLDFSMKKEFVRLFGGVSYSDYRRKSFQDISSVLSSRNLQIHTLLDAVYNSDKELIYSMGLEFSNNKNFGVGIKYNGSHNNQNTKTKSYTEAISQNGLDLVSGDNFVNDKTSKHHLNAYMEKKWSKKFSSDLFLDLFTTKGDRNQSVTEQSSIMGNNYALFNNSSSFSMFSIKPVFEYEFSPGLSSEFGGEFLHVSGKSYKKSNDTKVSEYNTSETIWAGFASLKTKIKRIGLQFGLRYEDMLGHIENQMDITQNLKPSSSNFLGDISASTALGQTKHAFSIKSSIERPKFGWLNNYSYYSDHYTSQVGNPTLRPSVSYQLQYKFLYKSIYVSVGYIHTRNFIGNYFYTNAEEPDKLLATWINYHRNQRFQTTINISHSFGFYHPNLTSSVIFEKLTDKKINSIKTEPLLYLNFDNNFALPWGLNLNMEYLYRSKATSQIFYFNPVHIVNIGLNKSFLDNTIEVSIKCKDLFRGDINKYQGGINKIQFSQIEDQDRRSVSVNLIWRFNKNKYSYRGQSQEKTINRL